jgi:DNA polymerase I-like protein with 3'-5' exonuclease and polymerase domains
MTITTIYQPSIFDLPQFRPDVELDSDTIIIGNSDTEYNTERLPEFISEFSNSTIFALDTETFGKQGAEALYFKFNYIRLIQIGLESGLVCVIDFGGWQEQEHWDEIRKKEDVVLVLELLAKKCFDNSVAILGVNLSFDFNNLRQHLNIICRQARDLMIISQVVWAGVGSYKRGLTAVCAISHSLAGIADRLGHEVDKSEQKSAWGWTLTNSQLVYAVKDARILFSLFDELRNLVDAYALKYTAWIECRAVAVFANMQYYGFPIRTNEALRIRDEEIPTRDAAIATFEEAFPGVQWTSQQQVLAALQKVFPDLEDVQKETLKKLEHPATQALVQARESEKLITDCQNILDYAFDGAVHCQFKQIGPAATGRSTSKSQVGSKSKAIYIGIQLQNPSKKVRSIFGFDDDSEMCLGIYDGSGMHQRIATELSQDPNLIAGYSGGLDMHSVLASQIAVILGEDSKIWTYDYVVANKEDNKLVKKYRDVAKKAFYSCLNGSGIGKILIGLHQIGFVQANRDQAKQIFDAYYELYKKLVNFIKAKHKEASQTEYIFDFPDATFRKMNMHLRRYGMLRTMTGRVQFIEKEQSKYGGYQVNYTKATAANWLLAEANLLKLWMADVQDKFWETPEWQANIINMVHDEINFVCAERYKTEVANFVVDKMQEIFSEFITIIPALENKMLKNPECGMCKNWSEK